MTIQWPENKIARMIEFYEDGRTINEIVQILKVEFRDRSINKNSVIGKMNRLRKQGVKIERIVVDD